MTLTKLQKDPLFKSKLVSKEGFDFPFSSKTSGSNYGSPLCRNPFMCTVELWLIAFQWCD